MPSSYSINGMAIPSYVFVAPKTQGARRATWSTGSFPTPALAESSDRRQHDARIDSMKGF